MNKNDKYMQHEEEMLINSWFTDLILQGLI